MLIDNAAITSRFGHYPHPRTEHHVAGKASNNGSEIALHHRHRHNNQDQLRLSDAAKLSGTQKSPVDMAKKPDAGHALNIQIIQRMVKSITGQDLQLFSPQALQDQADQVTVQAPTQAPDSQANSDTGLVYQQSTAYFESQTITFNAQGTINTKDGQSIDFSVSLSMSHILYKETNLSLSGGDATNGSPLTVNFEGNATELTTTHFEFAFDTHGSQDQVDILKSNNNTQEPASKTADTVYDQSEPASQSADSIEKPAGDDSQLIGMAKLVYQQLRIWQRHADSSQQLLALGEKNLGALYLGHLTAPLQPKAADSTPALAESAGGNTNLPQNNQTESTQQINFTA
ncbi:hypothetical protein [Methylomonas methanica]|uniref:Uncharacterized protein n=1 Tax=Methylomonas methanica (strain DSM 25384 / MC09) TaxID=857087 RepID=F9ZY48_METMM|nr:hypothetical protein [Methylomonas methanica]AEF99778.1 hypothetical protein Metme_1355 [Methylomonas methanica MC09]